MQTTTLPAGLSVGDDEALLLARTREDALAERAAAAILVELLTAPHAALLETLDAYLLTGNAVSAAHRLEIHAPTVRYRLKRIREITGRDPAQGWDRFVLEVAPRLCERPVRHA